jgi:hypothetical protein
VTRLLIHTPVSRTAATTVASATDVRQPGRRSLCARLAIDSCWAHSRFKIFSRSIVMAVSASTLLTVGSARSTWLADQSEPPPPPPPRPTCRRRAWPTAPTCVGIEC